MNEPVMSHTSPAEPWQPTVFVTPMAFRKDGAPSLGTFGRSVRKVVIIELDVWKRMCAEIPGLAATKFNVGSFE